MLFVFNKIKEFRHNGFCLKIIQRRWKSCENRYKNNYDFKISVKVIDEIPFQFQKRDFLIEKQIFREEIPFQYILEPKERGEYNFGSLNVYVSSPLGFVSKRFNFQKDANLPSYPSFIHLRKYELMAIQSEFLLGGIKK